MKDYNKVTMHTNGNTTSMVKQSRFKSQGYTMNNQLKSQSNGSEFEILAQNVPDIFTNSKVHYVIILLISICCFWSSQYGDFVFDDSAAILNNKDLQPNTPIYSLFQHDFWGNNITSKTSHKSYRPLTVLMFRLNYFIANGYKPWSFHVTNIILHSFNSILMYHFVSIIFNCNGNFFDSEKDGLRMMAFMSAILFASHPIHTENVAGIVGCADLLMAAFFMMSFILYSKWCQHMGGNSDGAATSCGNLIRIILFGVFITASMLSKEQGITVIGLCVVYDAIQECGLSLPRLKTILSTKTSIYQADWFKNFCFRLFVLALIGVLLLYLRLSIMGSQPPKFQSGDNPSAFVESFTFRILNYNYIYSVNAWLLIHPWWLCFDWAMGCVPLITHLNDVRLLCPLLMWIIIAMVSWKCGLALESHFNRLVILSVSLIVIPFLPATNVFFRVGFVIAERVLYLSSAGFCMLVVLGFAKFYRVSGIKKILQFGFVMLIACNVLRCINRSAEWNNEESLFTAGKSVCPLNAKVHYNVGKIVSNRGDGDAAIKNYLEALRLRPEYDEALNNLGNLYKDRKEFHKAEECLEKAVKISGTFAAAWMNLGTTKIDLKKFEEAQECLFNAVKHRHHYPDAYYNLGNLYLETKELDKAFKMYETAIQQDSKHVNSWQNSILLLTKEGRLVEAAERAEAAIAQLPQDAQMYYNLGNIYGRQNRSEEAEKAFFKAIKLKPNESSYHGNLGVIYHQQKLYKKAEKIYKYALQLNPHNQGVIDNYNRLKRTMARKSK